MSAYMALTQNIIDPERYYNEYVPMVMPVLAKHGIELLVATSGVTPVEGTADSLIILQADSEQAFRDWYDDPDYAEAKALRLSITKDGDMIVAPRFTPPAG